MMIQTPASHMDKTKHIAISPRSPSAADAIETKEICVATGSGEDSIVIKCEYYHTNTNTICVVAPPDNQVL
jgi:hypothetical protein